MVKTKKSQELNMFILDAFIVVTIVTWLLGLVPSVVSAVQQYATDPNLSGFYITFLYNLFMPLLVFGLLMGYRRQKVGLALVRENVLLTLIVWSVATIVSILANFAIAQLGIVFEGEFAWWYLELAVAGASVVATCAVLLYARRLGKW